MALCDRYSQPQIEIKWIVCIDLFVKEKKLKKKDALCRKLMIYGL